MILDVNDDNFDAGVLQSTLPVLVDCWAPSCKPCLGMQPVLEAVAEQYNGRLAVAKINIDENSATARAYNVRSLPTLLLIQGGAVIDKKLGVLSGSQISDWVERQLSA